MDMVAREVLGWLSLFVSIAGIVVAAMHIGRVRGAGLIAAGFALQTLAALYFRVAVLLMSRLATPGVMPVFAVGSVLGLAGAITVVSGVWIVLSRSTTVSGTAPPA
jgi:hypothetical protein